MLNYWKAEGVGSSAGEWSIVQLFAVSIASSWSPVILAGFLEVMTRTLSFGSTTKEYGLLHTNTAQQKKITAVLLDDNGTAVYADRFGDVYRLKPSTNAQELFAEEAELLMSHLAIVTCMVFTKNKRFLITGDNNEKIRVSFYPNAFAIKSFCLGHCEQITALLPLEVDRLVSSSGDGTIRWWNLNGDQVAIEKLENCVCGLVALPDSKIVGSCSTNPGLVAFKSNLFEVMWSETIQGLCVGPGDRVFCVDTRGHLRAQPAKSGGNWGDIFFGEDVPAETVNFATASGWDEYIEVDGSRAQQRAQKRKVDLSSEKVEDVTSEKVEPVEDAPDGV